MNAADQIIGEIRFAGFISIQGYAGQICFFHD